MQNGSQWYLASRGDNDVYTYKVMSWDGSVELSDNNNNMKEENIKQYKVVFQKTNIEEFTYLIMATDEKDALARIADGKVCKQDSDLKSSETKVISNELA